MTLADLIRVVFERWRIAIAVLVAAFSTSMMVYFITPPVYEARTSLYVSAQSGDNLQQAYQGAQLSEQRVKSYTELVTGDRVTRETAARLPGNQSAEQIAKRLSATSALDSVIVEIAATDIDPVMAAQLANIAAKVTTEVVDELERPTVLGVAAPVAVRVIEPALPPQSPTSGGILVYIAYGLLAGIPLALAGALLRNSLDDSIRNSSQVTKATGAPVLGAVTKDAAIGERSLFVYEDSRSANSEAIRQVRTNLQFIDIDKPKRVVAITSSVPGEGKTTTVANLAISVGSLGRRVLVIEADLRRPKLSRIFGLDRSAGLTQILAGRIRFGQAVQSWNGGIVDVLASGPIPPNPSELLGSQQMRKLLDEARQMYDLVVIDTPPLLPVTDAASLAPLADGTIVVCHHRSTSKSQLEAATRALGAVAQKPIGAVLTMVTGYSSGSPGSYNYRYDSIEKSLSENASSGGGRGLPTARRTQDRLSDSGGANP